MNLKRAGRTLLAVALAIAAGLLGLSLLVFVVVSLPPVQRYARQRAEQFLDSLLVGDIELEGIRTNLFTTLTVEKVVIRSPGDAADSVVVHDLHVGYSLWPLLRKTVLIRSIDARRLIAFLSRSREGELTLPFLPRAVVEEQQQPEPPPREREPSEWRVRISSIAVDKIEAMYRDRALDLTARVPAGSFHGSLPAQDSVLLSLDLPWAAVHSPWWSGELDTLQAEAAVTDSAVLVDTVIAITDGLAVRGGGRIPYQPDGTWDLAVRAFADVAESALLRNRVPGLAQSGELTADLSLAGSVRRPLIRLELAGSDLAYRDYAVNSLDLSAHYGEEPELHVRLALNSPLAHAVVEGQATIP
ncbi:MAG: hypothetical protein GF331_24490, partial [Chitinivibrionales bacterium]|nr:hypothetical protein [Chitinivibrionales bacterium]